jgi:hypothetical protein
MVLLNHFESIASAYLNSVGDKRMIEQSFRGVLTRFYDILLNFIAEVERHRGYGPDYGPWKPYTALVQDWKHEPLKRRARTA